jgi:hypothetical protein
MSEPTRRPRRFAPIFAVAAANACATPSVVSEILAKDFA